MDRRTVRERKLTNGRSIMQCCTRSPTGGHCSYSPRQQLLANTGVSGLAPFPGLSVSPALWDRRSHYIQFNAPDHFCDPNRPNQVQLGLPASCSRDSKKHPDAALHSSRPHKPSSERGFPRWQRKGGLTFEKMKCFGRESRHRLSKIKKRRWSGEMQKG